MRAARHLLLGALLLSAAALAGCRSASDAPAEAPAEAPSDAPPASIAPDPIGAPSAPGPGAARVAAPTRAATGEAAALDADAEAWARRMVDHPALAAGDADAQCEELLARVAAEPGHPLADAALVAVQLAAGSLDDPAEFARSLASLPSDGLSASAARRLEILQGAVAAQRAPVASLAELRYPDDAPGGFLLAPLGPRSDALALDRPLPQLVEPGFGAPHAGLRGEVAWRPIGRTPPQRLLQPSEAEAEGRGQALTALCFDVPGGGPAFVEVEARSGNGRPASYVLSIDGGAPVVVDRALAPSPARDHHATVLRDGRNRVVLQTSLGQRVQFAVRVLGADGRPLGVTWATGADAPSAPLGAAVRAAPPSAPPMDARAWLEALPARGPDTEALLGVLRFYGEEEAEGLALVRHAAESAPDRPGLTALLAALTGRAGYLPSTWKRSHQRALAESVLETEPHRLDVALHVAGILADEDREEQAIERLLALGEALPDQPASRLALADVYGRLGMDAAAESAVEEALAIAPNSPAVMERRARLLEAHGQPSRATELRLAALRASGAGGAALRGLADRFAAVGQPDRALELMREGVARDDDRTARLDLALLLAKQERHDEADALLAALAERHPRWGSPCLARADLALERGDAAGELLALRELLARDPSDARTRERLRERTGEDPLRAWFDGEAADVAAAMASYDDAGRTDSVVHVLDHAVVKVFPDGATETYTQDVFRVRDLQGCEALGSMRPDGESVRLAVVKPDGTEFEPVRAGGYVMPNLKPGDFVVSERRARRGAPGDGIVRPGSWSFASTDQPFVRSRYVISVPEELPLRLEQRHFDGTHETEAADGAVVHRFETRDRARVLPEPHAPPADWYLPWVEFGMDEDVDALLAGMQAALVEPTRVTPEVRAAAQQAVAGLVGDTACAKALHDTVNETLDQRGWGSATEALLAREGNAAYLYAALLDAAGVPHELVWSRDVSPDADPEPEPPFVESDVWRRKLLVLVQPRDGEPAFCDMDYKTLPYGTLLGDAPRAPAVAFPSRRRLALPDLPLPERPSLDLAVDLSLAADGSAEVDATLLFQAAPGWIYKEPVREIPDTFRKNWVTQTLSQYVPGLDLARHDVPGLEDDERPLAVHGTGRVPTYLDDDGSSLTCRLPVQALDLAASLAGGEGARRLPFFLPDPIVQESVVRMHLGEGLSFASVPQGLSESFAGGTYELSLVRDDAGSLTVTRRILMPPLALSAEQHADFAAFCRRVDQAERGVLRFARTGS